MKYQLSAFIPPPSSLLGRGRAESVEGLRQFTGDLISIATFDLMAFHHVNEFTVLYQSDGRGRRTVAFEVTARFVGGFDVGSGKDGDGAFGFRFVLERERNARN